MTGNIPEEEIKEEHPLEYEVAMSDYKTKKNVQEIDKSELTVDNIVRNKLFAILSKTVFTIFFLLVCIWMLWISYSTLMEAVNHYII